MTRWQRLLFHPRRLGLILKLALVALLAEGSGGGGFNFPSGNFGNWHRHDHMFPTAGALLVGVIVGTIVLAIGLVIFYICCRMKFVEFHIAITEDKRVGPAWSRYGQQTWRLFWVTICIGVIALIALAAIAVPIGFALLHREDLSNPSWQQILGLFLVLLPIFFVWFLAIALVTMTVRDLMLPYWALENLSVDGAWQRAREIIERAPKDFAKYALMKAVLRLAAGIVGGFALLISVLVSAIPVVLIGLAVYFPLRHGGHGAMVILIVLAAVVGLIFFAWLVLLYILLVGAPLLALQCYAVEWMGGRYPLLGSILWPPPPPPPPSYPPPADPELPPMQPLPAS
jgi:hypothetical protein